MINVMIIGLGSGLGGISRYLLASSLQNAFPGNFPFGTLAVNIIGCFFIGCMFTYLNHKFNTHAARIDAFIVVGFLGGFTTFSAFSLQTIQLIEARLHIQAISYVIISILTCLLACYSGTVISKKVFPEPETFSQQSV